MFIYTQCCVKKKGGGLRQLKKMHTVQRTKLNSKSARQGGKGENKCKKMTWSHRKVCFIAVNADVTTIRFMNFGHQAGSGGIAPLSTESKETFLHL